jgi:hypothetical protein
MRSILVPLVMSAVPLVVGCSREEEKVRPAFERAREELEESIAEGKAEASKALATVRKRWSELRPEAERAIASLEDRVEKLARDSEALKRLPPDVIERVRNRLDAMRKQLAEAKAAHAQGDLDLAVEKADAVQHERAAVEELLVERPDQPAGGYADR